jgi:magnesium-transporting ATPase (P-type)
MKNIIGITGILTAIGFPIGFLISERKYFEERQWYTNGIFWLLLVSLGLVVTLLVYAGYRVICSPTKKNVEASAGMTAIILVAFVDTLVDEASLDKFQSTILSILFGSVILLTYFWLAKQVSNANNASKRTS